jgi:hypothetical protein
VAAVLKDEINRYKKYGRREGQLGSIYATNQGRKIKSVYQDGWTSSKSGERQEIINDPENARVQSDNGDALLEYYKTLQDDGDRELFINSLVSRLSRDKEYYCVSYLILYVLFRIGELEKTLSAAEFSLVKRETFWNRLFHLKRRRNVLEAHQRHGFSDFLGLINGLLRYEHPAFADEELDMIEEFIAGTDEHTFRIGEKINSIRSYRISR